MPAPPRPLYRIPVTVLTGYLGAGKTTLVNRILSEPIALGSASGDVQAATRIGLAGGDAQARTRIGLAGGDAQARTRIGLAGGDAQARTRWAVIVNEFGAIGIDGDLIVAADEDLFQMSNGCICCTVRGDLIRTLHRLLDARAGGDAPAFDAILVETTGLADPGPVAQTFFVDPLLQERTRLDSVTTVVDARHIDLRLADSREAAVQIAFADQIVLNKTELVTAAECDALEARLRALNPLAPILRASHANVPLSAILGRGGFDLDRITALEPDFLQSSLQSSNRPGHGEPGHVHDETCGHDHDHAASQNHSDGHTVHDHAIGSVSLTATRPLARDRFEAWLTDLLATQGPDILRLKGILDIAGEDRRLVVQAVHMLLDGDLKRSWRADEARTSRLVLIGRHLDRAALDAGFQACASGTAAS